METSRIDRSRNGRSLALRPFAAAGYLLLHLPMPLIAGGVCLVPIGTLGAAGVPLAVVLAIAFSAGLVAATPFERGIVRQLGRDPILEPGGDVAGRLNRSRLRAGTYGLLSIVLAPIQFFLLIGWGLCCVALIASPALIAGGEGPIAIGPVSVDGTGEAWIALVAGLVLTPIGLTVLVAIAEGQAALARALLGPRGEELRSRVTELTRSRVRLVDAFDVERRRIERDLHDGAQQHLTALAMNLDLARLELDQGNLAEARSLIVGAHGQASRTITELRDLIQGIHPPALTNLGLPAAAAELAGRGSLNIRLKFDLPDRLDPAVETAAYFVMSEAINNAEKHSGARSMRIDGRIDGDDLRLTITDDGRGGADPSRGSGLAGLGDRVSVLGGSLRLDSPGGGPTELRAIIPLP